MDQPPGSICALPRVGKYCDPGIRELALTSMTQIRHVCRALGSKWLEPLNKNFPTGGGSKTPLTGGRGGKGRSSDGNHSLRSLPIKSPLLLIYWQDTVRIG